MSRAGFRKQAFLDATPLRLQQTLADPGSSLARSQGHLCFLEDCFPQLTNKEARFIRNSLSYS